MTTSSVFHLTVQKFERCSFELSWGKGQNLAVTIDYPENLTRLYTEWQKAYLDFYRRTRGDVAEMGSLPGAPIDHHTKLVQAEAAFLYEFKRWLGDVELLDIREKIAQASIEISKKSENSYIDIFLTCPSLELARFPWEVWKIGSDFGSKSRKIRIVRTAVNRLEPVTTHHRQYGRKARVLVILGDETGLDFEREKRAIDSLKSLLEVTYVTLQSNESVEELRTKIVEAIASESGWDILFFAGHSNETELTGGELGIAPNVGLSINQIKQSLITAKEKGLKFAIFNSCNGLSIANKLIELGLSQVAVMRTPIHNQVAGEFLVQFLQALSTYKDVHESLILASQYLLEKEIIHPSAYLIPSLFRYPGADIFRLQSFGIKPIIQNLIPSRKEAIALLALLITSLQLPVQVYLLQQRTYFQSIYRKNTGQVSTVANPPVLLVQIDEESIDKAQKEHKMRSGKPNPIDRKYLASLIDRLLADRSRIIGIDYVLDRPQGQNDSLLAKSIQNAVRTSPNPTWFIFAENLSDTKALLHISSDIADPKWSLSGETKIYPWYISLLPYNDFQSDEPWSFASLLILGHQLQQIPNSPQPKLDSQGDFFSQLGDFIKVNHKNNPRILTSQRAHPQLVTALSNFLGQKWLHPIIDLSIPPNQVYQSLPAWKLLENQVVSKNLQNQVVIIAAGGYEEAGINKEGEDNFKGSDFPPAIQYWREQENPVNLSQVFTGGEYHAYTVYDLLTQRLVIPIPDVWMMAVAMVIGKSLYLLQRRKRSDYRKFLIIISIITVIYGLISLQIYISSAAILLPWLLPTITLWFYLILTIRDTKYDT